MVSVALLADGAEIRTRVLSTRESSTRLVSAVDDLLDVAGLQPAEIDCLLGFRGPGSFTGLRVGLAVLLGLHQALRIRVGTVSSFDVLASCADPSRGTILACIDALREQWLVQPFSPGYPPVAADQPRLVSTSDFSNQHCTQIIGFGVTEASGDRPGSQDFLRIEPGPLAPQAIRLLLAGGAIEWGLQGLISPRYLRPASVDPSP